MKFVKPFYGCKAGDVYPTKFAAGDECPPELERAAKSTDALESGQSKRKAKVDGNPDA
ncbi:hypothetical protein [Allopusillimonas ginsengisoli]|uniref:hypothetical protein n=1 Tax=Allopusillimonas ginsengisoli TaxID=453575 RepID=UPI00143171B4|nr:hypothetical protein [Allopusillimonas ginsengisoli]